MDLPGLYHHAGLATYLRQIVPRSEIIIAYCASTGRAFENNTSYDNFKLNVLLG
jgi:hypothetical protein